MTEPVLPAVEIGEPSGMVCCAALDAGDPDRAAQVVAQHIAHAASAYRLRTRGTDPAPQ